MKIESNDIKIYPKIESLYKHYKGGLYKVLTLSKHTETNEVLVIYQSIHFGSIYARPLDLWFEQVGDVLRFEEYVIK